MSYGSVRQYRYRVTRLWESLAEPTTSGVSCPGCFSAEGACDECYALQADWHQRIVALTGKDFGTVDLDQYELVR